MKRLLLILLLLVGMGLGMNVHPGQSQPDLPTAAPGSLISSDRYIRSDRLGITFISSAADPADATRYRNALLLGAGWDRWPMYWYDVEREPRQYDWSAYDRVVRDDLNNGLSINAILLGMPEFYRDNHRPQGLHAPIFDDGTDTPGPGKGFNPDNVWAQFVFRAVQRYRPGGTLALEENWPMGVGISVWEVWNEPDYPPFWSGTIGDYARLLKVAYIAAHHADPQARVMFGGLLYNTEDNWLARVLAIYQDDPQREQFNWYMDMVAIHSYSYPWRSGWLVRWVTQTLRAYELQRPIWLNESGVPVWDDYPGPTWAYNTQDRLLRATLDQQAWFFIQSTAYAFAEGADVVFFHQLYDDCGNQPPGTDFPPHNGELCTPGSLCAGDAHGLFRNERDSACFTQHPFSGTPRPSATAYRLVAEVFGTVPFTNPTIQRLDDVATVITFDRPSTNERVYVVWNRTFNPATLDLPAAGTRAMLYSLDRDFELFPTADGVYQIGLPAAVDDGFPFLEPGDITAIGGQPYIIIERATEPLGETIIQVQTQIGVPRVPVTLTPGAVAPPPPRPTVDPALDNQAPITSVAPMPEYSPPTFTVLWHGSDDSGVDYYLVWVRVDGGEWQPWLETQRTQAEYAGQVGSRYEFAVWAVDLAGNWSANSDLTPQAVTQVRES